MGIAGLCVLFTESEGCSPEKSLFHKTHRPPITLHLRLSLQKHISKRHLGADYIKHNSFPHTAQQVEINKD